MKVSLASDFETPIMRDVSKIVLIIGISLIIGFTIFLFVIHGLPILVNHDQFIKNNECLYFKELQKTLCGQEAINYINNGMEG